jgi:hypothetical protein
VVVVVAPERDLAPLERTLPNSVTNDVPQPADEDPGAAKRPAWTEAIASIPHRLADSLVNLLFGKFAATRKPRGYAG